MRHQVFGRKFKRDIKERKALFRGLVSSLILRGRIKTTQAKAKAIKGQVDKLVNKAKKGTLDSKRQILGVLGGKVATKLIGQLAPNFSQRSSGFTQIIKIGPRKGDNAPMVFLQWIGIEGKAAREEEEKVKGKVTVAQSKRQTKPRPKSEKSDQKELKDGKKNDKNN